MGDNFLSFTRFTTLPTDIAQFGNTVEEITLQKGQPAADPVLSPMADPNVSGVRLGIKRTGSDDARLALPVGPQGNPYEGQRRALIFARRAVHKLRGNVVNRVVAQIDAGAVSDANLAGLMKDSIRRVMQLCDYMEKVNTMAEGIEARAIAASKG